MHCLLSAHPRSCFTGVTAYFFRILIRTEDLLSHPYLWMKQLLDFCTFHWKTATDGLSGPQHILPAGETRPSPPGYYHPVGIGTVSSRGHSNILSDQLLQGGREHGKTCEFLEYGPTIALLQLLKWVWNTIMVDKAFYKSKDGGFGRSIMFWKGKFITRISISVRTKCFPLH